LAIKLVNICLRNAALIIIRVKDYGTILCAIIRALPVQLNRIVRDGKKYFQQLAKRNLAWIINNADRLSVSCGAGAHGFILRCLRCAARISGSNVAHALYMLKNRLYAPKTSAGQDHGLRALVFVERSVSRRIGQFDCVGGMAGERA